MTVSSTTARVTVSGNGIATSFSFSPIVIHASTHLEVTHVATDGTETLLAEGSGTNDYTVVVASYPGTGSITYPSSGSDELAVGESLIIRRVLPLKQELDLQNQGRYLSANVEAALDKLTMIALQLDEALDRAVLLPVSSSETGIEIPEPEAGEFLRWNDDADALENAELTGLGVISVPVSIAQGGTASTTAATARTALGVAGLADNNVFAGTAEFDAAVNFDSTADFDGAVDFSAAEVHSGSETHSGAVTFTGSVKMESTDAGATVGPSVKLHRNSPSPANNDVAASVDFVAEDDASAETIYSTIYQTLTNVAAAAKAAKLTIKNFVAGAAADIVHVGAGMWMNGATGGDPGAGKFNATELQVNGVAVSPKVLQQVSTMNTTMSTCTTVMPDDDTIPTSSEGDEVMTLAITPISASSKLRVQVVVTGACTVNPTYGALYRDASAAIASTGGSVGSGNLPLTLVMDYIMNSPGTSATTFKVRVGPGTAGTFTVNGKSGARKHGGVMLSSIVITEIL